MEKPETDKAGAVRMSPALGAYLRRMEVAPKPTLLQRLIKPRPKL